MNGSIAGVCGLDRHPVDRAIVQRMLDALDNCVGGASSICAYDRAILGERMARAAAPPYRRSPEAHAPGSSCIAADARIDNRAELVRVLFPGSAPAEPLTDSAIILESYRRWSFECPARLSGDFAFAIWDAERQTLFCARDRAGARPFFYSQRQDHLFAFASRIRALHELPGPPPRLNRLRVADYLTGIYADHAYTFLEDIARLPPGHFLILDRDGLRVRSWWSLDAGRTLRLGSDQEYADAFLAAFTRAVGRRLAQEGITGAMLSGGLDSSSIAAVASRLVKRDGQTLRTLSMVFGAGNPCDESEYIDQVLGAGEYRPQRIPFDHDAHRPLSDLARLQNLLDEPTFLPNASQVLQFHTAIGTSDCAVVLDGHGGDLVVSHGYGYLRQLALEHRWPALARELRGIARGGEDTFGSLVRSYAAYGLAPVFAQYRIAGLAQRAWRSAGHHLRGTAPARRGRSRTDLVAPALAREIDLDGRYAEWLNRSRTRTEREDHRLALTSPAQAYALEVLNALADEFGFAVRFPFWDSEIVELCLSLPPEQKLKRGWGRLVLRRAMEGLLPAAVQWRRGKINFFPNITAGLARDHEQLRTLQRDADRLEEFVDVDVFSAICTRLLDGDVAVRDYYDVARVAALHSWLGGTSAGRGVAAPR